MVVWKVLRTLLLAFLLAPPTQCFQRGSPGPERGVLETAPAKTSEDYGVFHDTKAKTATATAITIRAGGSQWDNGRKTADPEQMTWIQEFCRTPGNEFFVEVPESFIRESMNLIDIGRGVEIQHSQEALEVLLGERRISMSVHGGHDPGTSVLQSSAAFLYGLLHARFVVSQPGLQAVLKKFSTADFGKCPRVFCEGQAVLPVGETDLLMKSSVKVFCPRCGDLFSPSTYARGHDGAFWGTTLPHLLLLAWPELKIAPNASRYVPRVFGFKVHAEETSAMAGDVQGAARQDHDRDGFL